MAPPGDSCHFMLRSVRRDPAEIASGAMNGIARQFSRLDDRSGLNFRSVLLAQAVAELLHPTGDIAHRLGDALGAEQQHDGCQDDDPVEKAERTHMLVSSP